MSPKTAETTKTRKPRGPAKLEKRVAKALGFLAATVNLGTAVTITLPEEPAVRGAILDGLELSGFRATPIGEDERDCIVRDA